MPLETATYISDLVVTNPANSDGLNQADDHMRLIKAAVKATFPGVTGAVTSAAGAGVPAGVVGTALFPAYAFKDEPALGFYRSNTSTIAYTGTFMGAVPIGGLIPFAGPTPPVGYFACDGGNVSRTTYAQLFAAIGTYWGVGDGSTTFGLPNIINRFPRHRDNGSVSGGVGTLQASQNQSHYHNVNGSTGAADRSLDHLHTYSGTTGGMNANNPHSHTGAFTPSAASAQNAVNGAIPIPWQAVNTGTTDINHGHAYSGTVSGMDRSIDHLHSININSGGGSVDGAEARPVSATVLFCIRAI